MDSVSGWIGDLVEQCLSSYLRATGPSAFRWTDNGTSLRFTNDVPPKKIQAIVLGVSRPGCQSMMR